MDASRIKSAIDRTYLAVLVDTKGHRNMYDSNDDDDKDDESDSGESTESREIVMRNFLGGILVEVHI